MIHHEAWYREATGLEKEFLQRLRSGREEDLFEAARLAERSGVTELRLRIREAALEWLQESLGAFSRDSRIHNQAISPLLTLEYQVPRRYYDTGMGPYIYTFRIKSDIPDSVKHGKLLFYVSGIKDSIGVEWHKARGLVEYHPYTAEQIKEAFRS